MEYLNFSYDSKQFGLANLPSLSTIPRADDYFWTWGDESTASNMNYTSFPLDGESSSTNSRSASDAGILNSPIDGDTSQHGDRTWDDIQTSQSREGPLDGSDETISQRIIRRRTQNRNAQRSYRQRREDERKILEDKLKVADNECRGLGKTCTELNIVVDMLRDQLKRLEAENTALRTSMYSMPWRKDSE